jgi:hypothetical protein
LERGRKMKNLKIFLGALFFAWVIFSYPFSVFAIPVVSIQTAVSNPDVGSGFDVFVNISNVSNLYVFDVSVNFDPSIIKVVTVTEGSFLPSQAPSGTLFFGASIDNTTGTIKNIIDGMLTRVPGASGSGTLADIKFQALSDGTSPITLFDVGLIISPLFWPDPNSPVFIPVSTLDSTVTVGTTVPESASLFFLGSGLVGIVALRKRLKK